MAAIGDFDRAGDRTPRQEEEAEGEDRHSDEESDLTELLLRLLPGRQSDDGLEHLQSRDVEHVEDLPFHVHGSRLPQS